MATCCHPSQIEELTPEILRKYMHNDKVLGSVTAHSDTGESLSDFPVLVLQGEAYKAFRCDPLLAPLGIRGQNDQRFVIVSLHGHEVSLEYRKPHHEDLCGKIISKHTFS